MKRINKLMKICFALVAVFSVVALAKMDAKAAGQITGLVQTGASVSSVSLDWNDVAQGEYSKAYYRVKGSNTAWITVDRFYGSISSLNPGATYEVKVELYNDYDRLPNQLVAVSPTIEVVTEPGTYTSFAIKQTKASATTATVSWNPCPGANCYEVEYNGKVVYVTGTSAKLTGLVKNKDVICYVTPCRKSSAGFIADSSNCKSLWMVVVPAKKPGVNYTDITKKELYINTASNCNSYADGYEYDIYRVKGNKRIKTVKSTSMYFRYSNKAFAKKDLFKVRVRSYAVGADNRKYYTGWSSWNYFSTDKVIKSAKSVGARGIQVKWNKINGASGYKVYASTKEDSKKYKVVATVKKGSQTSVTFKKLNKKALKSGKRYYIYVQPYYKSGKKTISMKNGYYTYYSFIYRK